MSIDRLPYARHFVDDDDLASVMEALRGELLTQGPQVAAFERELAQACDVPYAVAVSSGTAALHIAAIAADLGPGDTFVTSPLTFVASASAGVLCGATPKFVDIDRTTRNISIDQLAGALAATPAPKAVVAVHYGGWPVAMPRVQELARQAGAVVIEDACHALGAEYRDDAGTWHRVGSCHHADMTCFSFHPVKHITTGEGGVVTTRSEKLYRRLLRVRSHGIERDPARMSENHGPWYYEVVEPAPNYRLSDILAALGRSQLRRQPGWLKRRRELARQYDQELAGIRGLVRPAGPETARSGYHLYPVWVDEEASGQSRHQVFSALHARGIAVQVHYVPVHLFPYYRQRFGTAPGQYPEAERFYRGEISLPLFPQMTDGDLTRVVDTLREILGSARS